MCPVFLYFITLLCFILQKAHEEAAENRKQFKIKRGKTNKVAARNKNYLMKIIGKRSKGKLGDTDITRAARKQRNPRKKFYGKAKKLFGKKRLRK